MANLMDYLDWRGDLTLEISPFNEVDALILAELSFVDFDGIVPPPELGRRHDAVKVDKAQLCQNQRVHLVERRNFERQIPAPVQIIHQICHIVNLRQWVSFSFIVWRA